MTDVAEMKVIQSGKAKAPTNGAAARGAALAAVCIKYGEARMKAEEKEQGKLAAIVKSIHALERAGHAEFRAQLAAELSLIKELRKTAEVTKAQTQGYSFASFEVLVSNWRTISTAVEMGYTIHNEDGTQKPWGQVLGESVAMKNSHASSSGDGEQLPTKRKAGRKATPLIDKAIKAAEELFENNPEQFKEFCAKIEGMLKSMK